MIIWRASWSTWSSSRTWRSSQSYAGRGSDAHHPAVLVALLLYGYATGTFSSRALERASYD